MWRKTVSILWTLAMVTSETIYQRAGFSQWTARILLALVRE